MIPITQYYSVDASTLHWGKLKKLVATSKMGLALTEDVNLVVTCDAQHLRER